MGGGVPPIGLKSLQLKTAVFRADPSRALFDTQPGPRPGHPGNSAPKQPEDHHSTTPRSATQFHFLLVLLGQETGGRGPPVGP